MEKRLAKLSVRATQDAVKAERRALEKQFESRRAEQEAALTRRAQRKAEAAARSKIASMEQRLNASQQDAQRRISQAVKVTQKSAQDRIVALERRLEEGRVAADRAARKAAREAASATMRSSRQELEITKQRAAKERAQYAAEIARLKAKADDLSIRLERQSSEQMGAMTETDVLSGLRRIFHSDDIQSIDRGTKGADILHKVLEGGAEIGRIVYECKNASTWSNEWLTKARGYRKEYQTQWVVIASRCFPKRQKWFVVEKGIPVIDVGLVVRLAEVMRAAIVEIGSLRLTTDGRQAKAAQMFDYVIGDHFTSRFKSIGESVAALRSQQERERQWHSDAWAKQVRAFDDIDGSRREIHAELRAIAESKSSPDLRVLRAGA